MSSLRGRLFAILIATTGVIWLAAVAWTYVDARERVERVLDARLMEAARMVDSLITTGEIEIGRAAEAERVAPAGAAADAEYQHELSCQIWSLGGRLLGLSAGAPAARLSDAAAGFSEKKIDGQVWRVFAVENQARGVRILVGDKLTVRRNLVADLIASLLFPAAIILPALAFMIWASVGRGLRPLQAMAGSLTQRDAADLRPIAAERADVEIRPIIEALNGLFQRVSDARDRERRFTAFSAHELRTPLAGLRTQAQVALAAADAPTRDAALHQILVSVDRTSRLVKQLLEISSLDAQPVAPAAQWLDIGRALAQLDQQLAPLRKARSLTVETAPGVAQALLLMNEEIFMVAARNLLENALQHSSPGGIVRWSVAADPAEGIIAIEDDGPGIPEDELALVCQRFFRGRHKSGPGSGLGLAIVDLALQQAQARLRLANRPGGGLRAEIVVSGARLSPPHRGVAAVARTAVSG